MRHLAVIAFVIAVVVGVLVPSARAETRIAVRWGDYVEPDETTALVRLRGAEDASIDRVELTLDADSHGATASLTFRISTKSRSARDVRVPLEVSRAIGLTGLSYSIGGEPAIVAVVHDAEDARRFYRDIVEGKQDPALLRQVKRTGERDHHELAVFPVTRGMPATVTIEMTLPAVTHVVLDPGPHQAQRKLAVPAARRSDWMTTDPNQRRRVDSTVSLLAGDAPLPAPRIARREQRTPVVAYVDRRYELRVAIREHALELGHCYAYGVLRDPTLSASAMLAVDVAADGSVHTVEVSELADDAVRACIADEVESWRFAAADRAGRIRQAIELDDLD
jgi:hypothetical protein